MNSDVLQVFLSPLRGFVKLHVYPGLAPPWAAFFRRFAAENGTVLERSRSLGRAEDHDVGSAGKRYTPGGVIFWNHEVSGRTGAKSLERNELQAKSRKTKT